MSPTQGDADTLGETLPELELKEPLGDGVGDAEPLALGEPLPLPLAAALALPLGEALPLAVSVPLQMHWPFLGAPQETRQQSAGQLVEEGVAESEAVNEAAVTDALVEAVALGEGVGDRQMQTMFGKEPEHS